MAKGKYQKWLTKDGLTLLEGWAREGLTDEQIAHNMGISKTSFYDWKKKFPDISDTLKKGKEVIDFEVENLLLKNARGYTYTETKVERHVDENNNQVIDYTEYTRYSKPDTAAQIFWIKNRRPDKWREMSPEFKRKINAEADKAELEAEQIKMEIMEAKEAKENMNVVVKGFRFDREEADREHSKSD